MGPRSAERQRTGSSRSDERADMVSAPGFLAEQRTAQRNARAAGPAAVDGEWHGIDKRFFFFLLEARWARAGARIRRRR